MGLVPLGPLSGVCYPLSLSWHFGSRPQNFKNLEPLFLPHLPAHRTMALAVTEAGEQEFDDALNEEQTPSRSSTTSGGNYEFPKQQRKEKQMNKLLATPNNSKSAMGGRVACNGKTPPLRRLLHIA